MDRNWNVEVVAEALDGMGLAEIKTVERFSSAIQQLNPTAEVTGTTSIRYVKMTISASSVSAAFIDALVVINRAGGETGFPRWPLKSMTVSRHDG
jgi:hypothetical protein